MKKTIIAIGILGCLVVNRTYANSENQNLKKALTFAYKDNIQTIEFETNQVQKIDQGILKNYFKPKYQISQNGKKEIYQTYKIKETARNAIYDYNSDKIIPSRKGFKINNEVYLNDEVNKLDIAIQTADITDNDINKNLETIETYLNKTLKIKIDNKDYKIKYKKQWFKVNQEKVSLNIKLISQDIQRALSQYAEKSKHVRLTDLGDRFEIDKQIKAYKTVSYTDIQNIAYNIINQEEHKIHTTNKFPIIRNTKNETLNIIGYGRSDFNGSVVNRIGNIKMGAKLYNKIVIEPNSEFSYNKIMQTKGRNIPWLNAHIIVNGKDLKLAPGGGLCQTSTTIFRSAFNAGLPIIKWKNHSLYVRYYTMYGDGLDSTIFPGKQDMKFQNPYNEKIYLSSYVDANNNMHTFLISKAQKEKITAEGPFYGRETKVMPNGRTLGRSQIGWLRTINNKTEEFVSTYNGGYHIPKDKLKASQI